MCDEQYTYAVAAKAEYYLLDVVETELVDADNVTIRGAGMWHTIIKGEAAGFSIAAKNISFYDFSLLGNVTQRKDSIDPPAFDMVAAISGRKNIKLQNTKYYGRRK